MIRTHRHRAVRFSPKPRGARRFVRRLAPALAFLAAAGVLLQPDNLDDVLAGFTSERIRAHTAFLADDLLEGRGPGTRGGRIAAGYIAAHFQRAGLQPPPGGWYQPVPLVGWKPDPARVTLRFQTSGRTVPLRYPEQAVLWPVGGAASAGVAGDVVFVGHGVVAPEYDWDDFGTADLRGRILLFLAGDPPATPEEPDRFDGFALTRHGRWSTKLAHAARLGAAGALIIHADTGAGYPWSVVQSSWTGEQLFAAPGSPGVEPPVAIEGWIRPEAARFALAAAGVDLDSLSTLAAGRSFAPVAVALRAVAGVAGATRRIETANIIGVLPGRHPERGLEAVVLTAHYDHLGIGPPQNGDSTYNGAYDNASGVALLLELATAFGNLRPAPDRSIIFIGTAAEEAGLFGARQYVREPAFPIDRTAATLNLDGANLWGETADIAAVGAERSTLGLVAERSARRLGLRLAPERAADKGVFFRSDQFAFAEAGVPALLIEHGLDYLGRPPGWGSATLARYEEERYHRPGDRYDPSLDLAGAVQQARFTLLVAHDVANSAAMPEYHEDSRIPSRIGGSRRGPAPR